MYKNLFCKPTTFYIHLGFVLFFLSLSLSHSGTTSRLTLGQNYSFFMCEKHILHTFYIFPYQNIS